jgi:hypothetical protein
MRRYFIALLMAGLPLASHAAPARSPLCAVKVIHSEELPYAPPGSWLARVTLHVVPRTGPDFVTTVTQTVPWQKSAPRYGEVYWLPCDAAESRLFY